MFVRYPAPPGSNPRSVKLTRSPTTGEVLVTNGPPLPKTPNGVWAPATRTPEPARAAPVLIFPRSEAGG